MNGLEEVLRRDRMPIRLLLGDLPAAAGAEACALRFVDTEARGVSRRSGEGIGLVKAENAGDVSARTKRDGLIGLIGLSSKPLAFLVGEANKEGSIFSKSTSSKDVGEWRRLTGEDNVTGNAKRGVN